MARVEQIEYKAGSIVDGMVSNNVPQELCDNYYQGFINGANWADNNPKEGLVPIDKVCEWLKNNLFVHAQDEEELEIEWDPSITTNLIVCDYFNSIDDCINDFLKTLEL